MSKNEHDFSLLSLVLFFIFGGAIVGETVALAMVVTTLGPEILSNLYLINGLLLLLLPIFFFRKIDTTNRGTLLFNLLMLSAGILFIYLVIILLVGKNGYGTAVVAILIFLIYPISYLSKTILFLTFWTLANDVYATHEAKKGFPIVAAWGFIGGLSGACSARLLLERFDVVMIMGLWICAYCAGLYYSRKIARTYSYTLKYKEEAFQETEKPDIFFNLENIIDSRLIRLISVLYFFVFIAIFLQDYLFWKKSSIAFTTANALASFQFSYYLIHGFITIIGLRFLMPRFIYKLGFTRIFGALPIALLSGSTVMLGMIALQCNVHILFIGFIIIQAARYIVFENAFSPIYQMFFAAIPKEKRGRAKTFLEGIVKPSAIIFSGLILLLLATMQTALMVIVCCLSCLMIYLVIRLRKIYIEALIPQFVSIDAVEDIISKIGSHKDLKIVSLIREYSLSGDADVRSLAVKILSYDGTKHAFKIMKDIFDHEQNQIVREMIARSLKNFTFNESRIFVEQLLHDHNPRIRANTLYSVNGMQCSWKDQLYSTIRAMFFENNPRIQIEAAQFLWNWGSAEDKKNVFSLIDTLCCSKNPNKRSAGLYLVGILKPDKWELVLLENLHDAPLQVFRKSIETILSSSTKQTRLATLTMIEGMSRKYIACFSSILQSIGMPALKTIIDYLRIGNNQRLIVEVLHALRRAIDPHDTNEEIAIIDDETKKVLIQWAMKDLKNIYYDCSVWYFYQHQDTLGHTDDTAKILEDALRDQLQRLCERMLDLLAILDNKGVIAALCNDVDIHDIVQRQSLTEIVENCGDSTLTPFIVPILRNDEWEDIARIGKNEFDFSIQTTVGALPYFIRSNNKWIVFCSLYVWFKKHSLQPLGSEERLVLKEMHNDKNTYLSKVARDLLTPMNSGNTSNIEPFELLERVLSLKKTSLFRRVAAEKLMGLAEIVESRSYKNGTLISREGEISDHLYIVREGSLKIIKVKNNIKTQLSILGPGETYGEIGLFNQAPRSASAVASSDCVLWVIKRSALKKYLLDMPEIAYNFLEIFSEKLKKSSEEVAQLTTSMKREYL